MEWRYLIVFITTPVDKGWEIANYIVEEKLGACVNVISEVSSVYWWKGDIEKDKESLLVVKTSADKLKELIEKIKGIHPYTVPEIVAFPIVGGNQEYLKWVEDSLGR